MEPVYRYPQLNRFLEDFVLDEVHLKINAFFLMEYGRKIFPNPSQPIRLKTDFKVMVFQDIEKQEDEKLKELAKRVDEFNRKTPLNASPREKVNLINDIMPSSRMADLAVAFLESIYPENSLSAADINSLREAVASKTSVVNPDSKKNKNIDLEGEYGLHRGSS